MMIKNRVVEIPTVCLIDKKETNLIPVDNSYTMELLMTLSVCEVTPEEKWVFVLKYSEGLWESDIGISIGVKDENDISQRLLIEKEKDNALFCDYRNIYAKQARIVIENLKTPEGDKSAWLNMELYLDSKDGELVGKTRIDFSKGTDEVKIVDFYPTDGAVCIGGKTELHWRLSGKLKEGVQLKLYKNDCEIEIEEGDKSRKISNIQKSSVYRLELIGQGEQNEKQTQIQVLPIFLKTFQPSENRKAGVVEVCCANQVKIDGTPMLTPNGEYEQKWGEQDTNMYLEAENGRDWIRARLYASKEDEKNIALFRKTITCSKGMILLNVAWENLIVIGEDEPRAVAGKKLILIDKKNKTETTFYDCKDEKDRNPKEWEMILEGYSKETVDKEIQIKMIITQKDGKECCLIL